MIQTRSFTGVTYLITCPISAIGGNYWPLLDTLLFLPTTEEVSRFVELPVKCSY